MAFRDDRFKHTYSIQRAIGVFVWDEPLTFLRVPQIIDLKSDPYEYSYDASAYYKGWRVDHAFLIVPAISKVGACLSTYTEFPPRQRPATFSIDQIIEKLQAATGAK